MQLKKKAGTILDLLEEEFKDARIALNFSNPLELLIATILSAQCTDKRVNQITPPLFKRFRSAKDYAGADQNELEVLIKPTGFYKNKAKTIIGCCRKIVSDFAGKVPDSVEELTTLPGVGRKTANVVLGSAFDQHAIAVDRHVNRVANRLGLTKESDPDKIEVDLQGVILKKRWTKTTILFIVHGRNICIARKPRCDVCPLKKYCNYFRDVAG
ncbi:MAG: endonuclease III [Thermodesulfobacteriota bacterium]